MKKTNQATHRLLCLAATAWFCGPAQAQGFVTEDIGTGSGGPLAGSRELVIELLDAESDAPRLRLFGGTPGNAASISVTGSAQSLANPTPGNPGVVTYTGWFDEAGYYEISAVGLNGLVNTATAYASGSHRGSFGLPLWKVETLETSHGLEISAAPDPSVMDGPPSWEALSLQMPDDRSAEVEQALSVDFASRGDGIGSSIEWTRQALDEMLNVQIAEALGIALNSPGDTVELGLAGEVTLGNAPLQYGGGAEYTFEILRTETGYEVAVGLEAGAVGSLGGDIPGVFEGGGKATSTAEFRVLFRFQSLHGLVRGIKGIVLEHLMVAIGGIPAPASLLASDRVTGDIAADLEELVHLLESANISLEKIRDALSAGLEYLGVTATTYEARVRDAGSRRARLAIYASKLARSPRNPGYRARYRSASASYGVALVRLKAARAAHTAAKATCDGARSSLRVAQNTFDALQLQLADAQLKAANAHRTVWSLSQTVQFAHDHFAGLEVSRKEAVSIGTWVTQDGGSNQEAAVEARFTRRFEPDGAGGVYVTRTNSISGGFEWAENQSTFENLLEEVALEVELFDHTVEHVGEGETLAFTISVWGSDKLSIPVALPTVSMTLLTQTIGLRGDLSFSGETAPGETYSGGREIRLELGQDVQESQGSTGLDVLASLDTAGLLSEYGIERRLTVQDRTTSSRGGGNNFSRNLSWRDTGAERTWSSSDRALPGTQELAGSAAAEELIAPLLELVEQFRNGGDVRSSARAMLGN